MDAGIQRNIGAALASRHARREKADRFHAHVLNAMRQAKKQASSGPPTSSASELRTLWEMKQAGALTEEEFVQQKSHLLGKPAARGLE